jgi:3-oxoacyl-[acyl-carrier protein] reductase
MELKNAVGIVTGSAVGIGAACALALAKKGCHTVINFTKSESEAAATARECEKFGVQTLLVRGDVAEDADCRNLAEQALKKWGRIDALVNNAGISKFAPDHRNLEALQAGDFQKIYAVNVIGAFQMIRAVAPAMKKQSRGGIVNISSIAGVMGGGSSVAYAASKGALNTMTLSLARALAPEIRVNAVCPGFAETRWLKEGLGDNVYAQAKALYENNAPLHQVILPEDVARAVVWFLEGGDLVTGEFLMVDSGFHLGMTAMKAR